MDQQVDLEEIVSQNDSKKKDVKTKYKIHGIGFLGIGMERMRESFTRRLAITSERSAGNLRDGGGWSGNPKLGSW
jgi:hypothetical protein